ncbi:MAG TPA: glycosyltransferase [Egibacteraceae bacterium]|nr:glycosyltransferase [Egibacteraceae bacterium]
MTTHLRIAMVSEHASPLAVLGGVDAGGQNVFVASLATALGRLGHEVVVHTRRDDPALPERVAFARGVWVDHVDAGPPRPVPKDELLPYMDEFAKRLYTSWLGDPPDVVHSHFWMSGKASLAAARPLGIPVAHTFHALGVVKRRHQGDKDTSPAGRLDTERAIIAEADRVLATCTDEVFELTRLGAERSRVAVVPCGVDTARFTPEGPAEPRTPGFASRIVCLSRMVERKGIGNVIEALAGVPGAELVVAGGPAKDELPADAEYRRLRDMAERHGVGNRVDFRGRVERDDIPSLLRSADVVACTPWYEPFGIVPVEAMACGVPVVASAVGGMIDTVLDGVTGIHVPPRDPARVARALNSLLGDERARKAFGAAGARRARARYSWERIAADTLAAYPLRVAAQAQAVLS